MGDSELFSDLKSDFERSYRGEILVAGLLSQDRACAALGLPYYNHNLLCEFGDENTANRLLNFYSK